MIRRTDDIAELTSRIVAEIRAGPMAVHDRLLSERELALHYAVPRMRVHAAIGQLVEQGLLYTRNRSGTHVAEAMFGPAGAPRVRSGGRAIDFLHHGSTASGPHTLRIALPLGRDTAQARVWAQVIATYAEAYPFITPELAFAEDAAAGGQADVIISTLADLRARHADLAPLDSGAANLGPVFQELPADLRGLGRVGAVQAVAPLLRVPAVVLVNRDALAAAGLAAEELRTPADLMRIGSLAAARSAGAMVGYRYPSTIWNAASYGFLIDGQGGFDEAPLRRFLKEARPHFTVHHLKQSLRQISLDAAGFFAGGCAIFPCYTSDLLEPHEATIDWRAQAIPVLAGGFACEGMFAGGVARDSAIAEEAAQFLRFLTGAPGQQRLIEALPGLLAVHPEVLAAQAARPHTRLAGVRLPFDARAYYSQVNRHLFEVLSDELNVLAGKYLLGVMPLDETVQRLHHLAARVGQDQPRLQEAV